jgi:PBP4 family serine-type D-alanyl-D-alanine carboxypeptidase
MLSFSKILLIFLYSTLLFPQDTLLLKEKLNEISKNSYFSSTVLSLEVYDLSSLKNLYSLNNKLLLRPASNMKLLTSAAGILFLKDYSFTTTIMYTGEVANNRLLGDLYIRGGCDPAFSSDDLDSLILNLRAYGIHEITGGIYADVSFKDDMIWGRGWMWDDDPSDDAPYLSALNINWNVVRILADPSETTDKPFLKTEPSSSYFTIDNKTFFRRDSAKESFYVTRDWMNRTNNITASGSLNPDDP